jgi:flagellar biogenesis protein FliO
VELVAALRLLAALIVIAIVLVGLHFAVRSLGGRRARGGRIMRIVDTLFLPGAASLHVVAIADRQFVIGRSAAQITLLGELPANEAAPLSDHA